MPVVVTRPSRRNDDQRSWTSSGRLQQAAGPRTAADSLYGTRSRPFPPPKSGKIAVKVIDHYSDEVLKVFDVDS
ncbi:MAG: hypothetical protein ACRDRH_16430 [Pseudonocardia sp.]